MVSPAIFLVLADHGSFFRWTTHGAGPFPFSPFPFSPRCEKSEFFPVPPPRVESGIFSFFWKKASPSFQSSSSACPFPPPKQKRRILLPSPFLSPPRAGRREPTTSSFTPATRGLSHDFAILEALFSPPFHRDDRHAGVLL